MYQPNFGYNCCQPVNTGCGNSGFGNNMWIGHCADKSGSNSSSLTHYMTQESASQTFSVATIWSL